MLNMIKADLQRIFRGKGIWITLILWICFSLLSTYAVLSPNDVQVGVHINTDETLELSETGLDFATREDFEILDVTGVDAPLLMMSNVDSIFFFMLPIITFVIAADFSSGAVKNSLSAGVSRLRYYISKMSLASLLSLAMYIFHIIVPTIFIATLNGMGGTLGDLISNSYVAFLGQSLLIIAIASFGVFLAAVTKKTALMNGIYLFTLMAPVFIIVLLSTFNENFMNLLDYELLMIFRSLIGFAQMSTNELARPFLMGMVILFTTMVGGIVLFRKSEVK